MKMKNKVKTKKKNINQTKKLPKQKGTSELGNAYKRASEGLALQGRNLDKEYRELRKEHQDEHP
jgi:hypothetical protein